ncbi:branched-chain amino acid ABC transporter permease [Pseudomonas sp. NS1(2017)]|nr:branched-chain amino acid ABC transporter permease [Pseudomonas sp. NS1(2017)]
MGDPMTSTLHHSVRLGVAAVALLILLVLPWVASVLDQTFYMTFATRIMIFALAATSLNLVLGFGGLVAFGHAGFFGIGAYTVAILMDMGISSAWTAWPAAVAISAACALLIGLISLRTRGVYFIMITLSFAQMLYYIFQSLAAFGGDDGMSLAGRSTLPLGLDLSSDVTFYYVVLLISVVVMFAVQRTVNARFGRVLQSIRENESRMESIGYPVFRFKLVAFTLSGALAGLAGALVANQNGFISPNLMLWTQSGTLMIMVIMGGVGYLYGGVFGAALLLILEETLSNYTIHWQLPLGVILLLVVLFAQTGIAGIFSRKVSS